MDCLNIFKDEKEYAQAIIDYPNIFLKKPTVSWITTALDEQGPGVCHIEPKVDETLKQGKIDVVGLNAIGWGGDDIMKLHRKCDNFTNVTKNDLASFKTGMTFKKANNIESFCPMFDTSKLASLEGMFYKVYPGFSTIKGIPKIDTRNVTNTKNMFMNCHYLEYIPEIDTSNVTTMVNMFKSCKNLKYIPKLNTEKVTSTYQFLYNCPNVTTIGGFIGLKCNIELQYCPKLTHESIIRIFLDAADSVPSGTKMWLGKENMAKITEKEKEIIIKKGWTLLI